LFIKLKILKFKDLIDYNFFLIVFRAHKQLPRNIQELFQLRQNTFREISMFSRPLIRYKH